MDSYVGLSLVIIFLIAFSAFFSATETAYTSINRIRIKNLAKDGNKKAKLVDRLSDNYDRLLSTILIGNNIVNILSSSLATVLFTSLLGNAGVTVSTVVMTVLVLIFGEITPKNVAKESPEKFAIAVSKPISFFAVILTPFNYLFGLWKKLIDRIIKSDDGGGITEEELITIVDEAEDILTPRIDVCAVELGTDRSEIIDTFLDTGYSRLPVFKDTIDNIIGVIHQKDLFHQMQKGTGEKIDDIISPVNYILPSMSVSDLIKTLQKSNNHFAVVVDEYGGTEGIVTLEDVLEELVGEIWDEHDKFVENFKKLSDGVYEVLGSSDLEDFMELIGEEPDEDDPNTVSGWVMEKLARMPELGDRFEYNGHKVMVTGMENRRVAKIKLII